MSETRKVMQRTARKSGTIVLTIRTVSRPTTVMPSRGSSKYSSRDSGSGAYDIQNEKGGDGYPERVGGKEERKKYGVGGKAEHQPTRPEKRPDNAADDRVITKERLKEVVYR